MREFVWAIRSVSEIRKNSGTASRISPQGTHGCEPMDRIDSQVDDEVRGVPGSDLQQNRSSLDWMRQVSDKLAV
jgi:hypothetical protein